MTQIFAHRGANREATENTRAAFDRALKHAIDGIETDVQLSRDEVAVLWHDRYLGKIGRPDKQIDDFDYAQLQAMNFAAHFSPAATPEGLMNLQEFLKLYRHRCRLLVEIKNREWESRQHQQTKVQKTLALIGAAPGEAVMASSFNLDSLVYAHSCAPDIPLIYNLEPGQPFGDVRQVLAGQAFLHGLCLPVESLDHAMVRLLREHEKCIAVYTCNSDAEIGLALSLGVDILISDVPQKALAMRNSAR